MKKAYERERADNQLARLSIPHKELLVETSFGSTHIIGIENLKLEREVNI